MESRLHIHVQESDTTGHKYHEEMEMNKEPASDDDIRFRPTIPPNSLPFLCCQLTILKGQGCRAAISEELVRNAFFSVSTTTALNVEDSQNSLLVSIFIHIN